MASVANAEELDAVTCSVCKDVYKNPVKISCDHTFCEDCINRTWGTNGNQNCPVCRKPADGIKDADFDMIQKMTVLSIACRKCKKKVILSEFRRHERVCGTATSFAGPSTSLGLGDRTGANIYTFPCPYCPNKNLDREDLLRHVLGLHKDDQPNVVCPICKVMPWGNPEQQSGNFFDHIKLRHRFDYDRFVDLNQDEDTALKNTLVLSMDQH
ncbi:E3 ubiquitin-protein ligase RNF114-like [Dendronephthya gigantea]|uniref:E3 ubiquitin-protein ligase RNF114-like n=1 Tax=Dendronephthya gigantea TaxID=151771 RepID=UPI00106C4EDE|nr:E3 ubiquitin-protein ligase RNF114-like [Dendronephthya gigantea]